MMESILDSDVDSDSEPRTNGLFRTYIGGMDADFLSE